jgi:hypothetical protein
LPHFREKNLLTREFETSFNPDVSYNRKKGLKSGKGKISKPKCINRCKLKFTIS